MSDSLREPWLRGVAFNPAAPSDVLIRLLDRAAGEAGLQMCEGRDLPDAVIDAALRHPDCVIRRALAQNRYVDPARLAPLATDPSGVVRGWLASGPRRYFRWVRPLPDDVLVTLLTAQDGGEDGKLTAKEIIGEIDSSRQIPLSFFRSLADLEDPELRIRATWRWQSLTPAQRAALLDDPDPAVREAAHDRNWALDPERVEAILPSFGARNGFVFATCALSPALVERCFADGTMLPLARNRHTPAYALARLARHPDAEVRASVAARPDVGPELMAELREDPVEYVRMCGRVHPFPRTWAEYDVIDRIIGHGPDCTCPITEPFTTSHTEPAVGPSPDWFAACAVSGEPVLRRVAASWPGLSAQLVETLSTPGSGHQPEPVAGSHRDPPRRPLYRRGRCGQSGPLRSAPAHTSRPLPERDRHPAGLETFTALPTSAAPPERHRGRTSYGEAARTVVSTSGRG